MYNPHLFLLNNYAKGEKMPKIKILMKKKRGLFFRRTEMQGQFEVEGTLEEIRAIIKEKLATSFDVT